MLITLCIGFCLLHGYTGLIIDLSHQCHEDGEICRIMFSESALLQFSEVNAEIIRLQFDRLPDCLLDITNLPSLSDIFIENQIGLEDECDLLRGCQHEINLFVAAEHFHCCLVSHCYISYDL